MLVHSLNRNVPLYYNSFKKVKNKKIVRFTLYTGGCARIYTRTNAMLPVSVILTHVRALKPPSDELGNNISIRRLTFRNVCWGRKFLLHLCLPGSGFVASRWCVNIEIARSKEGKNTQRPGARRWILGWRWGWNNKCSTDAGQQSIDEQREIGLL